MAFKEQQSFRNISYEDELQRAKMLKEDLEKGDGWSLAASGDGYDYWIKTFHKDPVAIKIAYNIDMPFPPEVFVKLLDPKNLEARNDWDRSFIEHECLETFADEGSVTYMRALLSFPLADRSFVLYLPEAKEVDWFGKKATMLLIKHAWHSSKTPGEDGYVRATNGGNFYIITEDEEKPRKACHVFGLTANNYNGWIPKTGMEWMQKRVVPKKFNEWRDDMVMGYDKYFKE
ncbi:uncharacterized protein LOC114524752 [Dendronephthya gigantea]|uniref:uncharacterized protein LOC114524752 n=1 Tax=Dendronephthya gigantea TaxID=151771 RepID=UPI00106B0C63|nr:uncharacterized protein LOC114524752 [Dendronephthya gigantea]